MSWSGALGVEWIEYPVSLGNEAEEMTVTWRDGTTDRVPAHDGSGETLFQLLRLMTPIFEIENYVCAVGASGKFKDKYPTLLQSETGVLVLFVSSEERFMNAFICNSRDPAECLLSWIDGGVQEWIVPERDPAEGSSDFHWVSAREVLALIGTGLLDEFAPMVFDPDEEGIVGGKSPKDFGFIKVDLPWWNPPSRDGPAFGYPACFFLPETYMREPTLENLDTPSIAISVSQRLSEEEWQRILKSCKPGSIAEKIVTDVDGMRERFESVYEVASKLGDIWLDRWRNLD